MKGLLVRVGIDQTYGKWNAPVDPNTNEFVYMPIPEGKQQCMGLETTYRSHLPELELFCNARNLDFDNLGFPSELHTLATHHDPDFKHMTYGDVGDKRLSKIWTMQSGDIIVFYASLKPIRHCSHKLLYAIIGMYVIDEIIIAREIPQNRWSENAHTRRQHIGDHDVIIRAKKDESVLLERCIVIGEYRDKAYRVTEDLLEIWGGYLSRMAIFNVVLFHPCFKMLQSFFNGSKRHRQIVNRHYLKIKRDRFHVKFTKHHLS